MKPIKLEIEGIKSFKDKEVIDFESLLSSGLFGIFGDTGSGKSTILDCIIISLYGKGSKTSGYTELVNTDRLNASVDYTFDITLDGERRRFRIRREFYLKESRERKDGKAWLYEIKGDEIIAIADGTTRVDEKAVEIIGLNKEDFEKCIALPQGEFASFVNAQRAERLKIIGRLFSLERYGEILAKKIKEDEVKLNENIARERGKLDMLSVGLESVEDLEKQVELAQKDLEDKNVKYSKNYEYIVKNSTFYDKQKELVALKSQVENLENSKSEYDKKGVELSVYHLAEKVVEETKIYKKNKEDRDGVASRLEDANKAYNILLNSGDEIKKNYDEIDNLHLKIAEIDAKIKRLDDIRSEKENVEKEEKSLKEYVKLKEQAENSVVSANNDISAVSKEKSVVVAEFNAISIEKVIDGFSADFGNVQLKFEYQNAFDYFKKNYDYLVINNDNSVTRNLYLKEFADKVDEYAEKLKSVENSSADGIRPYIDELKSAIDKKDKLSKCQKELDDKLFKLDKFLIEQKSLISSCDDKIKLSRKIVDEYNGKVKQLVGDDSVSVEQYYDNLVKLKCEITGNISSYKQHYEEYGKSLEQLKLEVTKLESAVSTADELMAQTVDKIKAMFNSNLTSYKEASDLLQKYDSYDDLKKDVDEYNLEYNSKTKLIREYDKDLKKSNFDANEYELAVKNNKDLDDLRKQSNENLLNLKNRLEKARQNVNNSSIIENNLKQYLLKLDKITTLMNLVKSQGLMEFVADEFLGEICAVAEVTLKKLTGGRFGLVYGGNFFVIDNFYGGAKRAISTLSGGETFLVSLSLALALSQEIYSKSQRPIEFFFLDEGFGTLDENLIETVLESLEKLKNSNFSIGVISHVGELKERIQSKILVSGATQTKGTTIKTETYNG